MSFTTDQIYAISRLARLKTDDTEAQTHADQLNRILGLVEQMNQIDTAGIEPMSHPQDAALRLRADEVTKQDKRQAFQAIAPECEAGLYLVPRVID